MSLMVTSGGGYGVLAGNWLPLGYNPGGILKTFCRLKIG